MVLNELGFTIFDSFKYVLGPGFLKGVTTYVPKKCTEFEAVCIDHFLCSADVCCKPSSVVQCRELGHVQAADDHFPMSGVFRLPPVSSYAPIRRKKVRYDRAALGDASKSQHCIT